MVKNKDVFKALLQQKKLLIDVVENDIIFSVVVIALPLVLLPPAKVKQTLQADILILFIYFVLCFKSFEAKN